jgi:TPR repeat protein
MVKKLATATAVGLFMALALGTAPEVRADLQAGLDAYYDEDFTSAARELRPLAEGGDAKAQYRLGMMFDFGQGVEKNPQEAARLMRLAADQGDSDAQFALGRMYQLGRGVPFSPREGWWWLRQAANQGNLDALHWIVNTGECGAC